MLFWYSYRLYFGFVGHMESDSIAYVIPYVNMQCVVFWLGVSAFITLIRGVWVSLEMLRYLFFYKVGVGVDVDVGNRDIVENREREREVVIAYIISPGVRRQEGGRQEDFLRAIESWYLVVMPSSAQTCIGLVLEVFDRDDNLIMSVDLIVRADLFFRFPMERAKRLLVVYAEDDDETVLLANDVCVLLGLESEALSDVYEMPFLHKTYWIRILQRRWKRIYARRMEQLRKRGSLSAQRRFELTGKYHGTGLFERKKI